MKFKKMMLVTMLLLAILTIGAASAAEDVDALAVDDAGDDNVVEAPADDTMISGEDDDALPDVKDYISFQNDEVTDRDDEICLVTDEDAWYDGSTTIYANQSLVYNKTFSSNYVFISAKDLKGTFNGTYLLKIIYNKADGTKWFKEQNMTFDNIVGKTEINVNASDFNVTFPDRELDVDDDLYEDAVKFFIPLYVTEGWVEIRYGDGEYDFYNSDIYESMAGSYDSVYLRYLYPDVGTYNLTVTYANDDGYSKELAKGVLKVVKNYSPDDFITQLKDTISQSNYLWKIDEVGSSNLNGTVTIFDGNGSVAYNQSFSDETEYEYIHTDKLMGKFYGTCNFTVVYKRAADGKEYALNSTVDFLVPIVNVPPAPEDFNVKIADSEIDVDSDDIAVSFDWPEYTDQYAVIRVYVNDGFGNLFQKKSAGETSRNITIGELYIDYKGTYNITVYYGWDEMEIAKGTLKTTQAPRNYTGDDFIEIYPVYPIDEDDWFCTVRDYVEGYDVGLNGESYLYINGNLAYYNKFTGNGTIARSIWAEKDIAGSYNGNYPVKYVYKRATDGKEYVKELNVQFTNLNGKGTVPDVTPSNTTKPAETTPAKPSPSTPATQAPAADTVKLTLKTVSVKKSAKKLTLQVTLKVNGKAVSGKKITFKFNGKKYTAKTNAKGVAKVTVKKAVLKKLKVGKKVTYQATYGKTTVKKSVKIKK